MNRRHLDGLVIGGGIPSRERGYAFISRSPPTAARRNVLHPCEACERVISTRRDSARRALSLLPFPRPAAAPETAHRKTCAETPHLVRLSIRPAAGSGASPADCRSAPVACVAYPRGRGC